MRDESKSGYEKPDVKRIDLVLEETLAAGCKVGDLDNPCGKIGAGGVITPNAAFGS